MKKESGLDRIAMHSWKIRIAKKEYRNCDLAFTKKNNEYTIYKNYQ